MGEVRSVGSKLQLFSSVVKKVLEISHLAEAHLKHFDSLPYMFVSVWVLQSPLRWVLGHRIRRGDWGRIYEPSRWAASKRRKPKRTARRMYYKKLTRPTRKDAVTNERSSLIPFWGATEWRGSTQPKHLSNQMLSDGLHRPKPHGASKNDEKHKRMIIRKQLETIEPNSGPTRREKKARRNQQQKWQHMERKMKKRRDKRKRRNKREQTVTRAKLKYAENRDKWEQ